MDLKANLLLESYLFSREDVLKSLELFIEHEKANEEPVNYICVVKEDLMFRNTTSIQ